jgi:hypothetical protein
MEQSLLITPGGEEIELPEIEGEIFDSDKIEAAALAAFEGLRKKWITGDLVDESFDLEDLGWMALYPVVLAERPRDEKSRWRKAAYIAWEAWPGERFPATKEQLARRIGLRSGRQLYQWRAKDRTINEQIEALWKALITDEVRSVDRVGLKVAKEASYRNTQERRLFYQRQGVMAEDNTLLLRAEMDPRAMDEEQLNEWIRAGEPLDEARGEQDKVIDGEFND